MDNNFVVIYFVVINIIGFSLMGIDKSRAKRQQWRIPEKTLFTCALLGGSLGTIIGMNQFRHKTKHWYFKYGLPVILVVQILALRYIM